MPQTEESNGPWKKKTRKSGKQLNGKEMKQSELVVYVACSLLMSFPSLATGSLCEEEGQENGSI